MKTNKIIAWGVLIITLVLVVLIYLFWNPTYWNQRYETDERQPYDTELFVKLIKKAHGDKGFQYFQGGLSWDSASLNLMQSEPFTYYYLNRTFAPDSLSLHHLIHLLKKGNTAFIGAYSLTPQTLKTIARAAGLTEEIVNFAEIYFKPVDTAFQMLNGDLQSKYSLRYRYNNTYPSYPTSYFNDKFIERSSATGNLNTLSYYYPDQRVNAVRLKIGKGSILLFLNPLSLSNYFLKNPEGFHFAQGLLTQLKKQPLGIWDAPQMYSLQKPKQKELEKNEMPPNKWAGQSPLRVLLSNQPLKYALYTLLLILLLYLFFNSKRKQRAMALMPIKENASLEYAHTIAAIYQQSGDHYKIAKQKKEGWTRFIHKKYGLKTKNLKDLNPDQLAFTSGVKASLCNKILKASIFIAEVDNVSDSFLLTFVKDVNSFYEQCK